MKKFFKRLFSKKTNEEIIEEFEEWIESFKKHHEEQIKKN